MIARIFLCFLMIVEAFDRLFLHPRSLGAFMNKHVKSL